jgi:integrase
VKLCGLRWNDIDLESGRVNIHATRQYALGYGTYEKDTKNESSNRVIYIPNSTIELLKKYKLQQKKYSLEYGFKFNENDFMFADNFGKALSMNYPYKTLQKILKKNNLSKLRFHDLRHTSATLMFNEGVPFELISKRLGHSNTNITQNIYTHFSEENQMQVANRLNNVFKTV